jgi:hypothetical protein
MILALGFNILRQLLKTHFYRAVHWMDYTARTAGPIFSLAPRRRSGERVGVRGCLLSPILRTPQYLVHPA